MVVTACLGVILGGQVKGALAVREMGRSVHHIRQVRQFCLSEGTEFGRPGRFGGSKIGIGAWQCFLGGQGEVPWGWGSWWWGAAARIS